jgi:hypothetical protein
MFFAANLPGSTRLVPNREDGARCVRHDFVRCRHWQVSRSARYALLWAHAENDEIRFSHLGEFENLLCGISALHEALRLAERSGLLRNDLVQEIFRGRGDVGGGNEIVSFQVRGTSRARNSSARETAYAATLCDSGLRSVAYKISRNWPGASWDGSQCGPTVSTGQGTVRKISSATEPSRSLPSPVRPCVPITTKSALLFLMASFMQDWMLPSPTSNSVRIPGKLPRISLRLLSSSAFAASISAGQVPGGVMGFTIGGLTCRAVTLASYCLAIFLMYGIA